MSHPKEENSFQVQEVMITYGSALLRMLARYEPDHTKRQDLAQEIWIKIHKALPEFRGESSLKTWLYQIAIHAALDYHKTARRQSLREYAVDFSNESDRYADANTEDPLDALMASELENELYGKIIALPEDLRRAWILREFSGMSYENIARAENCPVGTVRSRLFRARESMGLPRA